ncbi:hypothetical protein CHS0354_007799 [Potamilus streckersoni]|uniref:Uncharacterized protein n=1 Tax=Potamilus streckersoni TaxID=2493646 RepID=A0AAE0SBN0_9BIVA|nr:hypothetical protein CHS0354_007799 [Potamilus streckersoni]
MDSDVETFPVTSVHNFGIYPKSGKRAILQLDFAIKRINLIERGFVKKKFDFDELIQFDSEDNLHIVVKFRAASIEFDADTAEEKYAICHFLNYINGDETNTSDNTADASTASENESIFNNFPVQLRARKQILKEGIMEKKGNTKIPTWSKRRVKVCPGEFSYFKPDDEVALNVVQLWANTSSVLPHGNNGIIVTVKERSYQFRLTGESKQNTELERKEWMQAFQEACKNMRSTLVLIEKTQKARRALRIQDICYNQEEATQALQQLDDVIEEESTRSIEPPNDKRHNYLSVVEKTIPMKPLPTKGRAKPPAIGNLKPGSKSESNPTQEFSDDNIYNEIPEPEIDYSPPRSPKQSKSQQSYSHGQVLGVVSGNYEKNIKTTPSIDTNRISETYSQVIKPQSKTAVADDAGAKLIKHTEGNSQGKSVLTSLPETSSKLYDTIMNNVAPVDTKPPQVVKEAVGESNKSKDPTLKSTENKPTENTHVDDATYENNIDVKAFVNRIEAESAPKSPPMTPHAPAPPVPLPMAPIAPPPPPPYKAQSDRNDCTRLRLKQVHWNKIPKNLLQNTIWRKCKDVTNKIQVSLLEDQFSLADRDVPQTIGSKATGKQLLIDPKRAQNLGILINGLKLNGTGRLQEALNSVTEDQMFPSEKLTTIRRYQPTQDEIDMYRQYVGREQELHDVDRFMLELSNIQCLSVRLDLVLTLWDFPRQYEAIEQLVELVHAACDELTSNVQFLSVLEYILAIGNHLNSFWSESVKGFQLSSIEKIMDIKGRTANYTMVNFLVDQLQLTDSSLMTWPDTVSSVKKCQDCSVKAVAAEAEVLKGDLQKMKKNLKTLKGKLKAPTRQDLKFQQEAQTLVINYEMNIEKLERRSNELHIKYRKLLEYFGEPMFQRSEELFGCVARLTDKFRLAMKETEGK